MLLLLISGEKLMNEWVNELDECYIVSKMMAIVSLLLCSRELLSPESSDCDLGGVILEKKKHAM